MRFAGFNNNEGEEPNAKGIFFIGKNMKNHDKNLSGKSDKRDVKLCKT